MARVTKVGLLAGLAFIICFAVILANRGEYEQTSTHLPYLVDTGDNVSQAVKMPDSQRAAPQTANARQQEEVAQPDLGDSPPGRASPIRVDRVVADAGARGLVSSGAEVPLPSRETHASQLSAPGVEEQTALTGSRSRLGTVAPDLNTPALADMTQAQRGSSLTSPPRDRAQQKRILQERLDSLSAARRNTGQSGQATGHDPDSRGASRQQQRASQNATPARASVPPQSARHTVVPGDTLSRIAAAYYDSRSATVINAIFEANRSVLSNRDVLRVGIELILPPVNGFDFRLAQESAQIAQSESPVRGRQVDEHTTQASFRWYQIKKGDSYISIAREQLGDGSRWQEIHELNRDKFPDPQRIREGVRIKLPLTVVTAARGSQS
jgi:nucleoid-associated protein YgaU